MSRLHWIILILISKQGILERDVCPTTEASALACALEDSTPYPKWSLRTFEEWLGYSTFLREVWRVRLLGFLKSHSIPLTFSSCHRYQKSAHAPLLKSGAMQGQSSVTTTIILGWLVMATIFGRLFSHNQSVSFDDNHLWLYQRHNRPSAYSWRVMPLGILCSVFNQAFPVVVLF